jgi:hypothetical protein
MNWPLIWFIVYLIELGILSYVAYLHFEEKIMAKKPKRIKFTITRTITEEPQKEKTKREIMEG